MGEGKVQHVIQGKALPVTVVVESESHQRLGGNPAPVLIFLDESGREVRRSHGFMPPQEVAAEMLLAVGQYYLLRDDTIAASEAFERLIDTYADSRAIPEALYWCRVARSRRN